MKNVLLIDALNARSGGAIVIINELILKLGNKKYDIDIYVVVHKDTKLHIDNDLSNINIIKVVNKYNSFYLLYWHIFKLPKIIKNYKVTHYFGLGGLVLRAYGGDNLIKIASINNVLPFIESEKLSILFPEIKYKVKWLLLKYMYILTIKNANYILLSSNYVKELIDRNVKVKQEKIIVELTGCTDLLIPLPDKPNANSKILNLIYLSPFWRYKNHDVIINAVEYLHQSNFLNFNVIFAGQEGQPGVANEIKNKIAEKGLEDYLHVYLDIPQGLKNRLLYNADILLYASIYEANSIILAEYLGMNRPIISTDSASNKEVLGRAALYFEPNDYIRLARLIQDVSTNNNKQIELKKHALVRKNELTWDRYVNCLIKLMGQ